MRSFLPIIFYFIWYSNNLFTHKYMRRNAFYKFVYLYYSVSQNKGITFFFFFKLVTYSYLQILGETSSMKLNANYVKEKVSGCLQRHFAFARIANALLWAVVGILLLCFDQNNKLKYFARLRKLISL